MKTVSLSEDEDRKRLIPSLCQHDIHKLADALSQQGRWERDAEMGINMIVQNDTEKEFVDWAEQGIYISQAQGNSEES